MSGDKGEPPSSWLFLRDEQAIHVSKMPLGMTLLVCGPGTAEQSHHFDSEDALDEFWRWYQRHLRAEGWIPSADRRSGNGKVAGQDRRRSPRS